MGKIHLALSGNVFHSDIPKKKWGQINTERLGLEIIGESGLPVSISFQGIDFEILSWLKSTLLRYPSIECVSATYGHGLIPLLHPAQQAWEVAHGPSQHSVTFFPEFYVPEAQFIPNMFFVLGPQTVTYILEHTERKERPCTLVASDDPEHFAAIRYNGRIGLVMRGFADLLHAFFAFQRNPYSSDYLSSPLAQLLQTVERIKQKASHTVIMPLDIEAPYIGSREGEEIWKILLGALKRSGLDTAFVSLKDVVGETGKGILPTVNRPHRELTAKWLGYEAQLAYYSFIRAFCPESERDHLLLSLAGTSDALSALYRKITSGKANKRLLLETVDIGGRKKSMLVGGDSDHVFSLCQSALLALKTQSRLTTVIHARCDIKAPFVKQVLAWAETHNL